MNAPRMYVTQEKCSINSAPRAIITPRMISAPTTPHSRRRCCTLIHGQRSKDHQEKKQVVNAESFFDQIAGEELQCRLFAIKIQHSNSKEHGDADPAAARDSRLANFNLV